MFANREKSSALNNFVVPSEPESRTLGIIQEFRQLYEDKMKIIDSTEGNGDCNLQAKLALQNDWIRDLNEQNEMLVRAVEELEQEATERVMALEEKLRQSAKCACELKDEMQDKQMTIKVLESKLDESLNRECQRCATLKQSMMDMRDALTAEVADKHDAILALKRDVSNLEEQCRKADQQTHFKDDIIKELRKEIKTLKLEKKVPPKASRNSEPYPVHEFFHPDITQSPKCKCPIKNHTNLELYKDFDGRVLIFVCEDSSRCNVRRVFDGQHLKVDYCNRRIVHQLSTDELSDYYNAGFNTTGYSMEQKSSLASIPSLEEEQYKTRNRDERDVPEKLSSKVSKLSKINLVISTQVVDNLVAHDEFSMFRRKPKNIFTMSKSQNTNTSKSQDFGKHKSFTSCIEF